MKKNQGEEARGAALQSPLQGAGLAVSGGAWSQLGWGGCVRYLPELSPPLCSTPPSPEGYPAPGPVAAGFRPRTLPCAYPSLTQASTQRHALGHEPRVLSDF